MDLIETSNESATIRLSRREVLALASSMNEALEAVEEWEFETRLGVTREEVMRLIGSFRYLPKPQ